MDARKQKILWLDVVSQMGGAQHSMFEVCRQLRDSHLIVEIAVPQGPLFDKFKAAGFTIYPLCPIRASQRGFALFKTAAKVLKAPHAVNQIIKVSKPDIVHANSLPAFMATRRISASTPVIWHLRDLQLPTALIRPSIHRASRIITASEAIDGHFTDMVPLHHRGKLQLVRNGIDPTIFENSDKARLRANHNLPAKAALIGMVAHLIPWKKHDVFIESAALIRDQIPQAHFAIIGKDLFNENARYLENLKALAKERGLENHITWISDTDQPETLIPALDLLIHPAREEPFGRIICEAMAARVPVAAADSGGPATIITDKQTGRLAADGTPEHFAEIAVELLQDPQQCERLAANAHTHVIKNYSVKRVCQELIEIYAQIYTAAQAERTYRPDKD